MSRLPLKYLSALFALVFLAGCFGGGSEGTGTGMSDLPFDDQPGISLAGLDSCVPQSNGQSLLCGSVTMDDGVTPVAGVEVRLVSNMSSSSSRSRISSRGIANEGPCLSDSQGVYACVLPSEISGIQTFELVPPSASDFELGRFQVDIQAGETTTVQPQILTPASPIGVIDDQTDIRFVTNTCDSLPVEPKESSTDRNRPTSLLVGAVAEAELSEPDEDSSTHYWTFLVTAGKYHLVIDTVTVNWVWGMGITASIMDSEDSEAVSVIDNRSGVRRRMRSHVAINVEKDMSLIIQTQSKIERVPYRLGLFEANMAVPTPFFSDCPDVVSTSIGTTESSSIGQWEERWFSLEMQPGTYDIVINSFANIVDIHQYEVDVLKDFAQLSTETRLADANAQGENHTITSVLSVEQGGELFIRFLNARLGYLTDFEMTINAR